MPTYAEAIRAYAEKQTAHNDRHDAAVTDLEGDVKFLNDEITRLQNTTGQVTQEDQAIIDGLQARGETIAAKLEALAGQTPPPPPPPPPA